MHPKNLSKNKKYHYFYKITNNVNGHYYYGIHSTDKLNDGYMGSGKRLQCAFKKYGKENFAKEILYFFDTREEASEYEYKIVSLEMILDENCYNICRGGDECPNLGLSCVIDKRTNKSVMIPMEVYRENKELYSSYQMNKLAVYDNENGKYYYIDVKEFNKNTQRYIPPMKNKIVVKNKIGESFATSVDDKRLLSGEITYFCTGKKHKPEFFKKLKETHRRIKHQQGERNSHYGYCWVYNEDEKITKSIPKEKLKEYIDMGYKKGRVMYNQCHIEDTFDKNKICELYEQGLKIPTIAKIMNIKKSTLYVVMEKWGLYKKMIDR